MIPQLGFAMQPHADIVVYTSDQQMVLAVECKSGKETSPERATQLRRNLLMHHLLPDALFFLLAYPTALFLWRKETAPDGPPDFQAAVQPVLKEYLGKLMDQERGPGSESLELALMSWLSDLASSIRSPSERSEADKMLLASGLYDKIRRSQVRFESTR